MKKRKLLVLTPLLALTLSGCFARSPLPATSGQSTSGSGSTTSTSSEPEETTYGTMDAPITVARAVEIAKEQYSDLKAKSFVDKDAYVKGVLKNNPIKSKDTDEYRFTVGDSFEATTTLDFYYGSVGEGVTMPVQGDSVIMLGRLLDVDGGTTIRLAGSESEQVADPVVKKTDHMTYTLTLEKTGEATVTGLPTSAKSGDKVEFTVAPGTGYDIDEVLIDGIYDYAADNKYSFTVGHNTKVTVTAVQGLVKSDLRKAFEAGLALESGETAAMTFKGTVVARSGNSFFLQDGKYGMYVYNKATEGIAVGKEVTVTSTIQNYNGTIETKTVSASDVTGYGTMPTAGEVTSLKSLATLRQNVLANAKNVKFITKDKEWSDKQTSIAKFDVNGETLTVKFEKYGYTATEAAVLNAAKEGDVLSIYSAVTTTNYGDPQLLFGTTSSFTKEVTPVVKPTTVTVTPATKEIHLDQKDVTLTATVGPEGADVKTVTWSSSHPAICDVNATTGLLDPKAISDTVVTITATSTANPDAKGTCAVTVARVPVTSVAITETGPINLVVGGATATLHTTVLPTNATDDSLDWSVSPATGVVSVANGVVTPVGEGTATVTAASHSDPDKTASIVFNVGTDAKHVESVTFDPTAKTIKIGDTFDLNTIVTVLPADATNKNLTWESSSAAVTVNDGVIEGKAVTTSPVTITATSQDVTTVKGEIAITVEKIAVTKIELNKDELAMTVGDADETLTVTVTPDNATEQGVTWSSSNPDAATVSDAGVVHAVAAGTAIITATSKDNADIKDICTVSVSAAKVITPLKTVYETALALQNSKYNDEHPTTDSYTFQGIITAVDGNSCTIQGGENDEYGYLIYGGSTGYATADDIGKLMTVTATLIRYNGALRTKTISECKLETTSKTITAQKISSYTELASKKQNVLVSIDEALLKTKGGTWSSDNGPRHVFTVGDSDITVTFDKYGYNETSGKIVNDAEVGNVLSLQNIATTCYQSGTGTATAQITFMGSSTVEKVEKHATAIAFKEPSYEISQGGFKDMSKEVVITPAGSVEEPTYTVSGNSGVKINETTGALEVTATASTSETATVTATITGLTPATCTITIKSASTDVPHDVTLTAGANSIAVTVNGDLTGVKCGTSSKTGSATFDVESGAIKLSFYAAAWNGVNDVTITISGVTAGETSFSLTPDAGIKGSSSEYTLEGNLEDYYFETTLTGVTEKTTITVTSAKRFAIFGVKYYTPAS